VVGDKNTCIMGAMEFRVHTEVVWQSAAVERWLYSWSSRAKRGRQPLAARYDLYCCIADSRRTTELTRYEGQWVAGTLVFIE
jgi:hypothetical protein